MTARLIMSIPPGMTVTAGALWRRSGWAGLREDPASRSMAAAQERAAQEAAEERAAQEAAEQKAAAEAAQQQIDFICSFLFGWRLSVSAVLGSFPGSMPDGGEQPGDVGVVEAGDGVAEVDGDASGEAGR